MRRARSGMIAVALVVLGILASALVGVSSPKASVSASEVAPDDRPNVVLIITDDMRADELEYLPQIQRLLVEQGVRYSNAISPHPLCCPARAELFTGQYGQNNGVRHNKGRWGGWDSLNRPGHNVGRWLRDAGYRTSYHGKYLNGYGHVENPPRPAGWTVWDAQIGGVYGYWDSEFFNGDRYRDTYITHVMRQRTGATMRRFSETGDPFLTVINHTAPHVTTSPPKRPLVEPKYAKLYQRLRPPVLDNPSFNERRVQDLPRDQRSTKVAKRRIIRLFRDRIRSLRSVDDAVAATVRQLDRAGELDNTYIVFTSDNGNGLGEHRHKGKNRVSDEMLDVPLVVRGPGIEPGTVDDTPVSLVDLPATIVDWADAAATRRLDGVSLADLSGSDEGEDAKVRDTLLVQTGDEVRDSTPGWAYRGVTTDRYLFAIRAGHPRDGLLFDRELDPHALDNVYDDRRYAEVRRELARRTRALVRCSGPEQCNQVFGEVPKP